MGDEWQVFRLTQKEPVGWGNCLGDEKAPQSTTNLFTFKPKDKHPEVGRQESKALAPEQLDKAN